MRPLSSLRHKIILSGVAIFLFGFGALILMSTDFLLKAAIEHSKAELKQIAVEKSEIIKKEIGAMLITGRLLARSMEHIQRENRGDMRQSAAAFLQNLVAHNQFIGMAAAWEPDAFDGNDAAHVGKRFGSPRGRMAIYYFKGKQGIEELLLDMRPLEEGGIQFGWYDVPINENREYLMPPYLNPVEGAAEWMTTAAIPIRDRAGNPVGSATVDLTLKSIQDFVSTIKPYDHGHASLVSQDGSWLAHPDSILWVQEVAAPLFKKALAATGNGEVFYDVMQDGGAEDLVVSIPLDLGTRDIWTLILSAPMDDVNAEALDLRNHLFFLSLAILAPATLLYGLFAQRTTLPLQELIDNLKSSGNGETPGDLSSLSREDEIGTLARTLEEYRKRRYAAEKALMKSEEHFRMLVETTSDWIWEMDTDANFRYVSPGVKNVLGYTPEELIDKMSGFDLMPQAEADKIKAEYKACVLAAQPFDNLTNINRHKDGRMIILESSGRPFFDENGNVLGYRGIDRDITERVKSAEKLKESEERYRAVVEDTPIMICNFLPDYTITFVNRAYCHFFNKTQEELTGSSFLHLIPEGDRQRVTANLTALSVAAPTISHEHKVIAPDGSIKWQRWSNRALFNSDGNLIAFHAVGEDITPRKEAEKRLAESQKLLGAVIEQSPIPMVIATPAGELTFNQACAEQLGFADEPSIKPGINLFEMQQPWQDYDAAGNPMPMDKLPLAQALKGNTTKDMEIRVVRKDGSERWEIANGAPIYDDDGNLIAGFVAFPDITKRKLMEDQLRQSQKMEAIGTLAGGVAHDFNNILGSILGFSELAMEKTPDDADIHPYLTQVHTAGLRAKSLVAQLLSFSRQSKMERQPLKIAALLQEVMQLIRATVPTNIEIKTTIDNAASMIMADATNIHQVVMNLCSNAAASMEERGGRLDVSLDRLELSDKAAAKLQLAAGPYIVLGVADNGPGIPKEHLERIFDPFFTTKDIGKGTGLGLSVVHGIIKNHNGAISVETDDDSGTRFTIYLPELTGSQHHEVTTPTEPDPLHGTKETILIVDDEPALVELGAAQLQRMGYAAISTTNPQEALDIFLKDPDAIAAVITDQAMPHFTGIDLAKKILESRPDMPIFLCTGFSQTVTPEKAAQIGIREMLMKPVSMKDLARALQHNLNEARR